MLSLKSIIDKKKDFEYTLIFIVDITMIEFVDEVRKTQEEGSSMINLSLFASIANQPTTMFVLNSTAHESTLIPATTSLAIGPSL